MTSSNWTARPEPGTWRNAGAASTAQASEAHEARIARFSDNVRSGSFTTYGVLECLRRMQQGIKVKSVGAPGGAAGRRSKGWMFHLAPPCRGGSHLAGEPPPAFALRCFDALARLAVVGGGDALADFDTSRLHGFRQPAHEIDLQQAVLARGALDLDVVG